MATTVTYKGATLTTVDNAAKVLQTAGTWMEDDLTLVDVSAGGGGLVKLAEYTPSAVRAVKIDLDASWFSDYAMLIIVPDLTFSASDWLYITVDSTSGGSYTAGSWASLTPHYSMVVRAQSDGYIGAWFKADTGNSLAIYYNFNSYIYWYMYSANKTMTGTITVYGVSI